MKVLLALTIALGLATTGDLVLAQQVTVYYQPTPFPAQFTQRDTVNNSVAVIGHVLEGYFDGSLLYQGTVLYTESANTSSGTYKTDSYLLFDVKGLPAGNPANIFLMPAFTSNPSPYIDTYRVMSYWPPLPASSTRLGWLPQPVTNQWWGMNATSDYNSWVSNPAGNDGYMFDIPAVPSTRGQAYEAAFWSPNYLGAPVFSPVPYIHHPGLSTARPAIQLTYTPFPVSLKLPLPGGPNGDYAWLLTNEIGGYECQTGLNGFDVYHSGLNFFSIDLSFANKVQGNGQANKYYETGMGSNIPVLAAASGIVSETGMTQGNGNYIVINHGDVGKAPVANSNIGLTTRYLHLMNPPARQNGTPLIKGSTVNVGDQIGIMGETGQALGVHVHFGLRYNGSGAYNSVQIQTVLLEGMPLKSFQTECNATPKWIAYYPSTNIITGK